MQSRPGASSGTETCREHERAWPTLRARAQQYKESMMTANNLLSLDGLELEHRRALSKLRNAREVEREKLLARLLRSERRAVQLRQWISTVTSSEEIPEDSDVGRLLAWTRAKLTNLENDIHPSSIADALRQSNLFPEHDGLHDPLGDPPPRWPPI
jgi:hypothetical protein